MTDKARELLERAVEWIEAQQEPRMIGANDIIKKIRSFLTQPEVKREALSLTKLGTEYQYANENEFDWFIRGVSFAEKHHGIGGGDE